MDSVDKKDSILLSASDIAKYLLEQKGTLTGYQLQKLLYYCQAWNLVINNKPLFLDEIRAFENGPAIPSVSMQHKGLFYVYPRFISGDSSRLSEMGTSLVDSVLSAYGGLSGEQLVALTHSEDPWRDCYNLHTGIDSSALITDASMQNYYSRLLTASPEEQRAHYVPCFHNPKNLYVSSGDYDWLLSYLASEE